MNDIFQIGVVRIRVSPKWPRLLPTTNLVSLASKVHPLFLTFVANARQINGPPSEGFPSLNAQGWDAEFASNLFQTESLGKGEK